MYVIISKTSKTLWYRFMKEYNGQTWYYDNIVKMAKQMNVSDDVMEYILQSVEDMKNNRGLTVLEEAEQPTTQQEQQQANVKATYTLNEQLNGIEITFNIIPSEETRNELKAQGFRWSKYKKVWYAKQTAERLEFAKMLAEEQTEEVAEQSEAQPPQELLFYHEALTESQNTKINEILNRHKDSDRFIFVAVYKCKSEPQHAILHVVNELGEDQYFYFTTAGLFAFSTHEISYYDRHVYGAELLHTFTNNSNNTQEIGNKKEEKAANDAIQDVENSNNKNEAYESDILQEEQEAMKEEAKNLNNTLANESPEDLQADNTHNTNQAETLQVSYKINDEKNGIELYFSDKPNEAIREQLKRMGFKWSRQGFWYAKKTDERLNFVQSLMPDLYNSHLTDEQRKTLSKRLQKDNVKPLRLFKSKNSDSVLLECINTNLDDQQSFYFFIRANGEEIGTGYNSDILNDYTLIYTYTHNSDQEKEPVTYPDINIDDIDTYVIDERLQEAEHAASWIFCTQKRDHTKEIQNFFSQYNNKVVEVLKQTDNERIKYYLKKSLQSFKKRYFENYIKILCHRSENPSWVVTGRGNLNKRRYDKALNRYDKLMQESIQLMKEIDRAIDRAKDEIRRDKEQRIKEAVKSVKNELTFTAMTKEIEYMGYKERKRVYMCGDY